LLARLARTRESIAKVKETLEDAMYLDAAIDAEIDELSVKIERNAENEQLVDEARFQIRKRKRFLQELGVRVVDDPTSELRKTYIKDMDRMLQ
jgi:hypothetical protein